MKKSNSVTDALRGHVNRELLKYTAGLHIDCPNCHRILDYKTVVIIEVWTIDKTRNIGTKVGCTNCFKPDGIRQVEKSQGVKLEIIKYEQ